MRIYEIDSAIEALIDPETGEITDMDAFEALAMERESKLENIALYIKDLTAAAQSIRQEELALQERRKAAERKVERLREFLFSALDGQKLQTPRTAVSFRKGDAVDVKNAFLAVSWLKRNGYDGAIRYKEAEVDKAEVKRILKQGFTIPGAELVERTTMSIK